MTPPETKRSPPRKPFDGVSNLISRNRTSPEVISTLSTDPSQMLPTIQVCCYINIPTNTHIHRRVNCWGDLNLPLVSFMDLDRESECFGIFFWRRLCPELNYLEIVNLLNNPL